MSHFVWNVNPTIFQIGFLQLRWYGLLFVGSFIVGLYIIKDIFKREGKDPKPLEDWLIYALLGAIIGARLAHCLFYEPDYYLKHPIEILYVWKGGLASHGGMIGAMIVFYLFAKRFKLNYLWFLSRMAIVGVLAGFFIRLGNFFNSEILGKATNVPWAIIFKRVDNIPRHPVQLYEAFSYLGIFFILYAIYKKSSFEFSTKIIPPLFLILVFGIRFILEFFKVKQADFNLSIPLTMGQVLSIPMVLIGLFWLVVTIKDIKRTGVH